MIKNINLGNRESALEMFYHLKQNKYDSLDVRIRNSHIKELNTKLGRNVFKNDVFMQTLGCFGKLCNLLEEEENIIIMIYLQRMSMKRCRQCVILKTLYCHMTIGM